MSKKIISLFAMTLLPLTAMSTTLQQSRTMWSGIFPVAEPLNVVQMQVLNSEPSSRNIQLQLYSRGPSGNWGLTRLLDELPMSALSAEPLQWVPQQSVVHGEHVYALLTGAHCEGDPQACSVSSLAIVHYKHSADGSFMEDPVLSTPTCSTPAPPELSLVNGALQVLDGCGEVMTLQDGQLRHMARVVAPVQQAFGKIQKTWRWALSGSSKQWTISVATTSDSASMSAPLEGSEPSCVEILPEHIGQLKLQCQVIVDDKPQWKHVTFFSEADPVVVSAETASSPLLSAVVHEKHVYAITGDEKHDLLINAHADDVSKRFSERKMLRRNSSQALQEIQRAPEGKIEKSGFYITFAQFQEFSRVDFLIFDGIPQNFPPFLLGVPSHTLRSGVDQDIPWLVMDEDTLPSELLSSVTFPDWLVLEPSERILKARPEHRHVGDHALSQTVTDPQGLSLEIPWHFHVELSPFQVMVFEPVWFQRWSLQQPIPLQAFLQQFPALPVMEDEEFHWEFSVTGRLNEEIEIRAENPAFASATLTGEESPALTLSGVALQSHVGEHPGKLIIKDAYAADSLSFQLPWRVIEVDEPFTIDSQPLKSATVGTAYHYAINVTDEESSIEDMRITTLHLPVFLQLDPTAKTLSGTPSRKDVGTHTIGLLLTDQGGHRVVHQWTLQVTETQQQTSGGAGGPEWLMLLFGIVILRQRHARCL